MTETQKNELIAYTDGDSTYNFAFDGETLWLTQEKIALLFGTSAQNVGQHIATIYGDDELDKKSTLKKIFGVVENRPNYGVNHYNLDIMIAVGYKVNSKVATNFRKWATGVISERILGVPQNPALAHDIYRTAIFQRVTVANKELLKTAIRMGVVALPAFFDAGYQGLYSMRTRAIQRRKAIGTDKVLERAGPEELAENEFRITQTTAKINKLIDEGKLVGQGIALSAHYDVAREIRGAIKRIGGELPENLPPEPEHISQVKQRVSLRAGREKIDG